MDESNSTDLIKFVEKMSGFSPVVMKIISLANNPQSSPGDLVSAISMDAMLTAKLLKLVNSAYFGVGKAISSLNRAVIMLGFNTIKNIALSVAVISAINIKDDFKWFSNEQFWEHCLGCAIASRTMAKAMKTSPFQVEEHFVAGLLHDIGKAVLIQKHKDECEKIYDPEFEPSTLRVDLENKHFNVSHAMLGNMIAQQWKFPQSLSQSIAFHHNPISEGKEINQLALSVYVADHYTHLLKIGIQDSANLDSISSETWEAFGLDQDEVESCLSGLSEEVENAKEFINTK